MIRICERCHREVPSLWYWTTRLLLCGDCCDELIDAETEAAA